MNSQQVNIYPETKVVSIIEDGKQLKLEYASNGKNYELKTPEIISIDKESVFRPIQYLGAKHRPLPIILSKTLEAALPNTFILDLFSGSSVVSQVFNLNGLNVVSNDAMKFSAVFARTLLNIGRSEDDLKNLPSAFEIHDRCRMVRDIFNEQIIYKFQRRQLEHGYSVSHGKNI